MGVARTPADRFTGCLLGLAVGDAIGASVEFMLRGSFEPLTDMVGGGPFELAPGQWTDDTSMALCMAESLIERRGFDALDQMQRYVRWWRHGHWSSTGKCFDVGNTVRAALERFEATGDPFAGPSAPYTAGNGSLMRLAPAVLFAHPEPGAVERLCIDSSRTTHGAPEAIECCRVFGALLNAALAGADRSALCSVRGLALAEHAVAAIAAGAYAAKPREGVRGSGYCVESLEAALWCFQSTSDFGSAVLAAANLGDDADTTAAITGQIAGAHYGASGIPGHWLARLHRRDEIAAMALAVREAAEK